MQDSLVRGQGAVAGKAHKDSGSLVPGSLLESSRATTFTARPWSIQWEAAPRRAVALLSSIVAIMCQSRVKLRVHAHDGHLLMLVVSTP